MTTFAVLLGLSWLLILLFGLAAGVWLESTSGNRQRSSHEEAWPFARDLARAEAKMRGQPPKVTKGSKR